MTDLSIEERARIELALADAKAEGYRNLCVIDGLICSVHPMAFTFGLLVNINDHDAYERRYCYETFEDALVALGTYLNPRTEHAPGPWIKVKGRFKGEWVDDLNPNEFNIIKDGYRKGLATRKVKA